MKKIVFFIASLLTIQVSQAQDLHFSQTAQTPLLINPAAAGVFDGWERAIINHRNQWLGAGTQFMSTAVAVDANLWKSEIQNDRPHLGVGLMFFNDVGGDSKFGHQNGSLTVSGILPMGRTGHIISAGIQGGIGQRKADISNISFLNQWDGTQFDQNIVSGEANTLSSFTYLDASAGLYYVYDGGQNTFARDNDFKLQIGFSGYHLNRPALRYISGSGDRLHTKWVGHVGVISDIAGSPWAIDGSALQFIQGGHYETLLGLMLRYRFQNGTKITGLNQNAFVGFGLYSRIKDGIIPSVMVDWKGFQFGMSYDVTLSALRKAYRGGSLEFSLSFTNLDHSLFKTRGRRL